MSEIKVLNIYQRINRIMNEVSYLQKTKTVGKGDNAYKAMTHDHVSQSIQPLFVKHGVVAIPSMVRTDIERYMVKTKFGESNRYETRAIVKVKFVNIDAPGDFFEVETTAHGFDNQDKSCGKAYSMAVKYCYLKLLMLASGDDEEQRIDDSNGNTRVVNKKVADTSYAKELNELKKQVSIILKAKGVEIDTVREKLSKMKPYNFKQILEKSKQDGTAMIDYIVEFKGE